jgi:hypothetical protein
MLLLLLLLRARLLQRLIIFSVRRRAEWRAAAPLRIENFDGCCCVCVLVMKTQSVYLSLSYLSEKLSRRGLC